MTFLGFFVRRGVAPLFILAIVFGCSQPAEPVPVTSQVVPVLTAIETPVNLIRSDGSELSPGKDETVPVQLNETMTAGKQGQGLVVIEDRLNIDMFHEAELKITTIEPQSGDSLLIRLEQLKGHIRVRLAEDANARLSLHTSIAQVTTLTTGTDFIICHNPVALSCIVVIQGAVEVAGQDKLVTIRGGEATYVLKDEQPFDPICARPDEVDDWIDRKTSPEDTASISQLVAGWEPEPCSVATQRALVPTPTAEMAPLLPASEGMVQVAAGEYTVGAASPNSNQVEATRVSLPAFWIDRFEVTNAQYQAFIEAAGWNPPAVWPGEESRPVAGVTWNDAEAYCAWANKRLPTEAEWEAAARGPGEDPPLYPWGDDSQAGGQVFDMPLNDPYPVGSFGFNQSAFGVYDMAGNLWEWVGEPYAPVDPYMRVLRGGRYGYIRDMAHREQTEANNQRFVSVAGFRCAADQVEGE